MRLHIDGKEVEYVIGGRGIMVYGTNINGQKCLVSDHSIDPSLLTPGVAFRTGGHLYEMKYPARHFSLD